MNNRKGGFQIMWEEPLVIGIPIEEPDEDDDE